MTPEIQQALAPADAGSPALARMRRFTTWIMVFVVAAYVCLVGLAQGRSSTALVVASLAVGALVCWQCVHWEHGARPALAGSALLGSYALSWAIAITHHSPEASVAFSLSVSLVASAPPFLRWWWSAPAVGLAALPAAVFGDGAAVVGVATMTVAALALVRGNRFGFGLYLEIDQARKATADLAVLRERYRFAADLHDIQGQALHVSRLKLRLADKLLAEDPDLARTHIREAEQLIAGTIAETRSLAYGERDVTLAGELANSASLIRAAGIELDVRGRAPVGHRLEELFALVVREATTNLLRHAQAEHVRVELGPDSVRIVNDGATDATRELRGLARLGERFAGVGGTLETSRCGTTFVTSARGGQTVATSAPDEAPARGGTP